MSVESPIERPRVELLEDPEAIYSIFDFYSEGLLTKTEFAKIVLKQASELRKEQEILKRAEGKIGDIRPVGEKGTMMSWTEDSKGCLDIRLYKPYENDQFPRKGTNIAISYIPSGFMTIAAERSTHHHKDVWDIEEIEVETSPDQMTVSHRTESIRMDRIYLT